MLRIYYIVVSLKIAGLLAQDATETVGTLSGSGEVESLRLRDRSITKISLRRSPRQSWHG
jgi:hypothetical protein